MIRLHTNRELAVKFGIPPARWKRWTREFLPPDPLAGKQSGYARQMYTNDAFFVFLGGRLVSDLGFTIPQAKQILRDLDPWLKEKGFYFDMKGELKPKEGIDRHIKRYMILIGCRNQVFGYLVKGLIFQKSSEYKGIPVVADYCDQVFIGPPDMSSDLFETDCAKLFNISGLLNRFRRSLNLAEPAK